MRVRTFDLELNDGRTLHAYDTGTDELLAEPMTVFWHHGTPNIGTPPEPLFPASERLGIRWISYDRPGYGGSTRHPGRDVASVAADVSSIADALGIDRFAAMGHSGGGPHALACAALLPEQVVAAVSVAGLAPYGADGLDWFGGMGPSGAASLRAALEGIEAKERYEASSKEEDFGFTPADRAALAGEWSWFGEVVVDQALRTRLHGRSDRGVPSSHSEWLARRCPSAELWLTPDDGHISILTSAPAALEWLRRRAT